MTQNSIPLCQTHEKVADKFQYEIKQKYNEQLLLSKV